ncbi:MAG TPA: MFS transporter [Planctomycetota bacterium]|nr:MFS transporter [Planctomycetota bacterium]
MATKVRSEAMILAIVGAVQFINILDFMIVMPLGPDFAVALDIPKHEIPSIGAAYTAAGGIAGLLGSQFLDRFDRRKALVACMFGLFAGTWLATFATGLHSLMAARVIAGMFGGPASSLAMSIVSDVVPAERRGRAMGAVMGMFAAASVLGVPLALELSESFGWQSPFYVVALLGLSIALMVIATMPPMTGHLEGRGPASKRIMAFDLLRDPTVLVSYAATLVLMASNFAIVPILSTYLQFNLGYPRKHLSILYFFGGMFSFVGMRLVGRQVDRHGAAKVAAAVTGVLAVIIFAWFVRYSPAIPVIVLFVGYMLTTSIRGVAYQTVTSKVPSMRDRAGYTSLQSAMSHIAAALGAWGSSLVIVERGDGKLDGMDTLGLCAIGGAAMVPLVLWLLERRLKRRDGASGGGIPIA